MDHVAGEELGECIANADIEELDVAARLSLWRHLNHTYRERYRQHRDAEEAVTKAEWEAANLEALRDALSVGWGESSGTT